MTRRRKCCSAPAAITVAEYDDLVPARGELGGRDRGIIGLRTAAGEERFFQPAGRDLGKFLREVRLVLVSVEGGGVLQLLILNDDGLVNSRICVSHADGQDPAEAVQISVPRVIPHELALAADKGDRLLIICGDRGEKKFLVLANGVGDRRSLSFRVHTHTLANYSIAGFLNGEMPSSDSEAL